MANTPLRRSIDKRSEEELLDDLCRELRYVAVNESDLPNGERVVSHIHEVSAVHAELSSRHVDFRDRLGRLSQETRWQMKALLDDCLAYPKQLPYVRELDGIRRYLRCRLCGKAERPPDAKLFWFCEACIQHVLEAVKRRTPISGIILFRTYNVECRCTHADADTVLAGEGQYYVDEVFGVCERCIQNEIERRNIA
jgi:phosphoglycerate-specific signal transduction histidine kinase